MNLHILEVSDAYLVEGRLKALPLSRGKEGMTMQVKYLSGDPMYIAEQLTVYLTDGWELLDIATNVYQSSSGLRTETTVYLKKAAA